MRDLLIVMLNVLIHSIGVYRLSSNPLKDEGISTLAGALKTSSPVTCLQ